MEKLKHLIGCLKPQEVQLAEQYFKLKSGSKGAESKKLKLFKLILKGKVDCDERAAAQLYEKKSCSAYSHLKKRLHEDILSIILMSSQQDETDNIAEEIKCRKQLIQGKLLINRGVVNDGLSLLKNVSDRAEEYEFLDIKLAADDVLRTYSDLRSNLMATRSYDKNINESFNLMRKILYAKQLNYEIRHPDERHDTENQSYDLPLRPQREGEFGSKRLDYWYNKFEFGNSQQKRNFDQAEKYANTLLETVKKNPRLYNKVEIANLFLEVGHLYFREEKYNQAAKYASGAMKYYENQEARRLDAMRVVFLSLFRRGEINQSWDIVNEVLNGAKCLKESIHKPIWVLQKATLEFTEKHYNNSVKTLQSGYNQLNHKSDWAVGYRLLELLNILELQDYDWLEYKLEAFRKFVFRLHSSSRERYCAIHKVFKKYLSNTSGEQRFLEYLHSFNQNVSSHPWDPMGVEIINIPKWFEGKLKGQSVRL
ncbi:MAG: hypothetical protein AAFN93_04510 [Bacteroidota bacterium]